MSKDMKVIMEGWRDFFKDEPKEKTEPRKSNFHHAFGWQIGTKKETEPAFFIKKPTKYYKMILWRPTKYDLQGRIMDGEILGMLWFSKTKKPCIPDTYEVNFSAVAGKLRKKGVGAILYGLAFHYVNKELNGGLTSDHSSTTNDKAQALWDKYADTTNMVKRATDAGNDEFDYENITPDEEDDCGVGADTWPNPKSMFFGKKYRKGVATHSSWTMEPNQFEQDYNTLTKQHEKYAKEARNIRNIEDKLIDISSDFFIKEYLRKV